MENISFTDFNSNISNKKNFQTQQTTNPIINNANSPKLKPQIESDVVELSTAKEKKQINKKKIALIGALAAGAIVVGGIAIAKVKNTEKIKKELTALYDKIYDSMAEDTTRNGLNFEKPKLIFEKFEKGTAAAYCPNDNTVTVNTRNLRRYIKKDLSKLEGCFDGKEFKLDIIFCNSGSSNYRKATKAEAIASCGSSLYHELTHAKQFQYALSTEGGAEKMINGFKKANPNLSEKEFRDLYPFLFSYKPKKLFDSGIKFVEDTQKGSKVPWFGYNIDNIVDAFTNYDRNNIGKYFLNLAEVSAKNGEACYWQKLLSGKLPKPEGLDDATIQNIANAYRSNTDITLQIISKLQKK